MFYCVTGVVGSVIVGKLLDKYKCYKLMINLLAITLLVCLTLTFVAVHYSTEYKLLKMIIIIFTGAPMFSVSVPTFQFVAEVIYPVSEIQGISLVNVINKLVSFGTVKLGTYLSKK
jgi:predicted MFS family arabinose efflux permease